MNVIFWSAFLHAIIRRSPPGTITAAALPPSDVLELYDESERRYFYCDMAGFPQVKFSPALAKKA